ncbi:MAG: sigma-54-dependent Fis family transcriptional regulator [Leucobacter sp.]
MAGSELLVSDLLASDSFAAERSRFLAGDGSGHSGTGAGGAVVPAVIRESWQRSLGEGVDPESSAVSYFEVDPEHRLARCARMPVQRLVDSLAGLDIGIVVSEETSRIVHRLDTGAAAARLLDTIDLAPGSDYSECAVGTNGVGTALASGRPVYVAGAAYYRSQFTDYVCAGVPIRDPVTGSVTGVIDLTCAARDASPLLMGLARQAAAEIEDLLLAAASEPERAALAAFSELSTAMPVGVPVLAAAGQARLQNRAAEALFSPEESSLLVARARDELGDRDLAEFSGSLPGGLAAYRATVRRLVDRSPVGHGVLLALEAVAPADATGSSLASRPVRLRKRVDWPARPDQMDRPDRLDRTAREHTDGTDAIDSLVDGIAFGSRTRSRVWQLARRELSAILRRRETVIVLGEVGTGKVSLVRETVARELPGVGLVVLSAAELHGSGDFADAVRGALSDEADRVAVGRSGPLAAGEKVLLLRNVQQLSETELRRVAALLRRPRVGGERVTVLLTAEAQGAGVPELEVLLPYVSYAVTVPALRERGDDFVIITEQLLEAIEPGSWRRLDAEALNSLATGHWPGNITQLADALSHAVQQWLASGAELIGLRHLPSHAYYAGRRSLGTLEREERNAIISALYRAQGNRSAAARALGMSRATLYRRLACYGLE